MKRKDAEEIKSLVLESCLSAATMRHPILEKTRIMIIKNDAYCRLNQKLESLIDDENKQRD